jgi:hypothetical protein
VLGVGFRAEGPEAVRLGGYAEQAQEERGQRFRLEAECQERSVHAIGEQVGFLGVEAPRTAKQVDEWQVWAAGAVRPATALEIRHLPFAQKATELQGQA